jgi:hypothetical protein
VRSEVDERRGVGCWKEIVVTACLRGRPAKVVAHKRRVDGICKGTERVEVSLVKGFMSQEIEPHTVKDHRSLRANRVELPPRRRGDSEKVFADCLAVVDPRDRLSKGGVQGWAHSKAHGFTGEGGTHPGGMLASSGTGSPPSGFTSCVSPRITISLVCKGSV